MKAFLRSRQSPLIALAMVVAIAAWMLSGTGDGSGAAARGSSANVAPDVVEQRFRVRYAVLHAVPVTREVIVRGRTEPARAVTLRAEVDGRVVALGAQRGDSVESGATIARIDIRDRESRLAEAQARVRQYAIQYEAYSELEKSSYQSRTGLAEANAALAAARAAVRKVEVEIENTVVRVPFAGSLERRPVEIGDYLSAGDEVARIIERDPIVVSGHVTQHELARLHAGAAGVAELVTGERLEGNLRFIAAESDPATRTFAVELLVPNPGNRAAVGVTAEIRIPTGTVSAHRLSPALLSLDRSDAIGVKSVGPDGLVGFHPVEVVRAGTDGIWVTGLPEEMRVITVGHGYVRAGDTVEAVPADAADTPGA